MFDVAGEEMLALTAADTLEPFTYLLNYYHGCAYLSAVIAAMRSDYANVRLF